MPESRPNILLLMTDQHRGDCLGIDGHPVVQTPYLDWLAEEGVRFRHGYTACPVCIPARRTLMTGRRPASHGTMMNYATRLDGPTLPGELSRAGYQTHLVGKLHLHPLRKLYGFDSADWADAPHPHGVVSDYDLYLQDRGITWSQAADAHGAPGNGFPVRPWHLDEQLHFTNWCADRAVRFLQRRDPTVPFFLKVSFLHPHQPLTPPEFYYNRYMNMDLPEPVVGDWARVFDSPKRGLHHSPWRVCFAPIIQKQMQAAYYGCVNHIDDQIGRILHAMGDYRAAHNTIVLFTSDHGEMLGDHQWIRKRSPYEPSARVPYLMRFPESMGVAGGQVREEAVELMDIMPTLLDAAGADIPETVEGRSLMPLLRGQDTSWREFLHGECAEIPTAGSGQQYLTDGRTKYVFLPGTGVEQLFDLANDPMEMHDLAADPARKAELERWRGRLIEILRDRPEGFVKNGQLQTLGGPTPFCMPGYERET